MAHSALVLVVAFYAAVATAHVEARRRKEAPPRWARALGAVAVLVHFLGLYALGRELGRSPFDNASEALSFLAFALAGITLTLQITSRVATHGGGFHALSALLAALSVPGVVTAAPLAADAVGARDPLRTWHIGVGLLAAAATLTAGLMAIGYLRAYMRMKRRALPNAGSGPSITAYARVLRHACIVSVALLLPLVGLGIHMAGRENAPAGGLILTLGAGLTAVLMAASAWVWWRRPLRGALAAWLVLGSTGVLIVMSAIIHPLLLVSRGGAG